MCRRRSPLLEIDPELELHQSEHWPLIVREYRAGFIVGMACGALLTAIIFAIILRTL
jgi:Mg/Co/Ni transporter MgtE